jgi:flagellar biogenesis protein FliO
VRPRKLILLLVLAGFALIAERMLVGAPSDAARGTAVRAAQAADQAAVPDEARGSEGAASNAVVDSVARIKSDLRRESAGGLDGGARPKQLLPDWQSPGQPVSGGGAVGKALQGLGLCLGAFLVTVGLARRFRRPAAASAKSVRVVERVPLSTKTTLVVVEFDGERILLTQGSEQIARLVRKGAPGGARERQEQLCREEKLSPL